MDSFFGKSNHIPSTIYGDTESTKQKGLIMTTKHYKPFPIDTTITQTDIVNLLKEDRYKGYTQLDTTDIENEDTTILIKAIHNETRLAVPCKDTVGTLYVVVFDKFDGVDTPLEKYYKEMMVMYERMLMLRTFLTDPIRAEIMYHCEPEVTTK